MPAVISGTEGYAEEATLLIERWRHISFESQHKVVFELSPSTPGRILDIGSGIGTDAAAFAAMGHQVVAVEPTEALRVHGIELYRQYAIEWLDDSLPDLSALRARNEKFELIMLTAVWMHLDEAQRCRAMPIVASFCEECRSGVLSGMYSMEAAARFQLPVKPPTFVFASIKACADLYRCNQCGAWWEFSQREAHVINEDAAKAIYPALKAD